MFNKTAIAEAMQYMIDSKVIDKIIALDPTNDSMGNMWHDKGTLLEWLGDFREAGDCYMKCGWLKEADAAFAKAKAKELGYKGYGA
jgi:hypothetical protein